MIAPISSKNQTVQRRMPKQQNFSSSSRQSMNHKREELLSSPQFGLSTCILVDTVTNISTERLLDEHTVLSYLKSRLDTLAFDKEEGRTMHFLAPDHWRLKLNTQNGRLSLSRSNKDKNKRLKITLDPTKEITTINRKTRQTKILKTTPRDLVLYREIAAELTDNPYRIKDQLSLDFEEPHIDEFSLDLDSAEFLEQEPAIDPMLQQAVARLQSKDPCDGETHTSFKNSEFLITESPDESNPKIAAIGQTLPTTPPAAKPLTWWKRLLGNQDEPPEVVFIKT